VVDPSRRFDVAEPAPPVVIESVRVDAIAQSVEVAVTIESGPRKLDLTYAGLALRIPERVRYRHRMVGYDDAWVDVEDARSATFTNLAPGSYRFEVAASSGGSWTDPPASIDLLVVPRWWESNWFRIALAMLALVGVWGLLQWRLRRSHESEQRLAALVEARTHDLADQAERLAAADREKSELLSALRQQAEALARLASEDSLTGLPNRRAFDERLARAFERARREHEPLAVAFADIDHFKRINDTCSHAVGDEVLRHLAHILRRHASSDVFVARYGGEEFALLFTGPAQGDAHARCERLRYEVERMDLTSIAPGLCVTLSLGVAHDDGHHLHHEKLLSAADEKLYEAKRAGRNKVV
jgi:diguanylate cyclase (GGDEF)-like protein